MNKTKHKSMYVILLVTLDTKKTEANFLLKTLSDLNINSEIIDTSLKKSGKFKKAALIDLISKKASNLLKIKQSEGPIIPVVLGGGTGMQIGLKAMVDLNPLVPRFLIGTFPMDIRSCIANSNITIIPTLVDVNSNGPILEIILRKAAKQIAATTKISNFQSITDLSVGISGLGVTEKAVKNLRELFQKNNERYSVFHANGFGGSGLEVAIKEKWLSGLIDLTTHEATRLWISGDHTPMPLRFEENKNSSIPRITVPGGINFLSLGNYNTLSKHYKKRKFFIHSEAFTHVCLNKNEMIKVANKLIEKINRFSLPTILAIPMGGFSSEDIKGGSLENIELRETFKNVVLRKANKNVEVVICKEHISSKSFANKLFDNFNKLKNKNGEHLGSQ